MNIRKFVNNHPVVNHAETIRAICRPLNLLNIKYFSHVRITDKNQFSALATTPGFFETYFNKRYFNYDLHMANVEASEKLIIWDLLQLKKQSSAMHQDFMSFNFGHTFSIVSNHNNVKNCYHFGAQLGDTKMNGQYLNLVDELKLFINYFTEKVAQDRDLKIAYSQKFTINSNAGGYLIESNGNPLHPFLESIRGKRTYSLQNINYLTQREIECLNYLAKGKTLEETAVLLHITTRTVKAHINAAKQKLNAKNQFQLGLNYSKLMLTK